MFEPPVKPKLVFATSLLKQTTFRSNSKNWMSKNQDIMSESRGMSTFYTRIVVSLRRHGTLENTTKRIGLEPSEHHHHHLIETEMVIKNPYVV